MLNFTIRLKNQADGLFQDYSLKKDDERNNKTEEE